LTLLSLAAPILSLSISPFFLFFCCASNTSSVSFSLHVLPTTPPPFIRFSTGTPDSLEQLLSAAVAKCPGAEILWLVWAKEKWSRGDVAGAREVLVNAFKVKNDRE
jgi:pre-mRNA-processing factor 6